MSTQRGKRVREEVDLDDYEPDQSQPESSQRIKTISSIDWDEEETQRKVKDVVRYCISCEYKRKTIRREDLQKHLQLKGYSYNAIITMAKSKLKHVFGYDLFELPSSSTKQNPSKTQQDRSTQTQATDSQAPKRGGVSTGTYVLVSALKEVYNTPQIITRSTEEYQYTGMLYIILGLIFLNANEIGSPELAAHMDRLLLLKNSKTDLEDREKILDYFVKNAYLKKTKKPDTDGEEIEYIYTAGPRAKAELPIASLVHFMCHFYGGSDEEKQALARKMYIQAGFTDQTR
ncbi:Non-structural maintenance of chromosome element 3 [Choanephora cucurbitarum]|uniref:Non-structural maintenance of chromosome element 3 n=1 Tax=Choanephora cucurbitarum TaxID=101091 RepID=A0A1C7NQ80_9FUNG|nr:Non-structural maintenance of chromosome element 3 [Choanephora cucurbitarum]